MKLRFHREARASLPIGGVGDQETGLDEIFDGLAIKRLVLHQTQQLSLWNGAK